LTHNIHKIQGRRGLYTQHIGRRGLDTQHTQHTGEKGSLHTRYRRGGVSTHNSEVLRVNVHKIQGRNGLDAQHMQHIGEAGSLHTTYTTYRGRGVFTHNICKRGGVLTHNIQVLTHSVHNIQGRRGLYTQHIGEEGS